MNLCFFYEFMCETYVGFVGCRAADEVCLQRNVASTGSANGLFLSKGGALLLMRLVLGQTLSPHS